MKVAVVLFNLGGPDKNIEKVEPFINLFNELLNLPSFVRYPLAKLISKTKRDPNKPAKDIYKEMGGSSPILKLTKEQASSLEQSINMNKKGFNYKVFITMRCFDIPRASDTIKLVKKFNPAEIILLSTISTIFCGYIRFIHIRMENKLQKK